MKINFILFSIIFGFFINNLKFTKYAFLESCGEEYEIQLKSLEDKSNEVELNNFDFKFKTFIENNALRLSNFLNENKNSVFRHYCEPVKSIIYSPPDSILV
jgi:hypothetical protein